MDCGAEGFLIMHRNNGPHDKANSEFLVVFPVVQMLTQTTCKEADQPFGYG